MSKQLAGIGLMLSLMTAGCGGTDPTEPPGSTMQVRLVNALAGTDELRLLAKGATVLDQIAPGVASDYVEVPADATTLRVERRLGGGGISVPVTPVEDGYFAVTAMGDNNVLYAAVAEADTGKAVPGRANLRAINLAGVPPAPEIDIYVTAPGASLEEALPAWQVSSSLSMYTGLKDFPPGNLQVRLVLRGTTTVVAQSAVLAVGADQIRVITLRHTGGNVFDLVVAVE